jgi:hypothetical protein
MQKALCRMRMQKPLQRRHNRCSYTTAARDLLPAAADGSART